LGIYYGGTGLGIVLSALLVPRCCRRRATSRIGWTWAWWALALACFAGTAVLAWPALILGRHAAASTPDAQVRPPTRFAWRDFGRDWRATRCSASATSAT
jgi:hypothetical protein